ncbi:uncharacterized protein [Parasteatoda tepidariorum]|uniref:uncharacterized protein isoform X2 n=1 Tax=Parasteatoda tepidariorum TaxID=114398 RepID=UPI0039BD6AF5
MLINLILTIVLLTKVNGLKMPSSSNDIGEGDHFQPCQIWIKCGTKDKAARDEFDACLKLVPDDHELFVELVQIVLEEYSETCANPIQANTCTKMIEINECFIGVLNRVHAEGKC